MKKIIIVISILAILIVLFNITLIDFGNLLSKNNTVPVITIIAGLCCLMLLLIVRISNKIKKYNKEK